MGNAARELLALSMYADSGSGTYYNMRISLTHTAVTNLSTTFADNYGGNQPTQIFSQSAFPIDGANWRQIIFDTPFDYNGTDNLLIEIRWQSGRGTVPTGATEEDGWKRTLMGAVNASTGTLQDYRNVFRFFFSEHEISGVVQDTDGNGVAGVTMLGLPDPPASGLDGFYRAAVWDGWSGTVMPRASGYVFTPAIISYTNMQQNFSSRHYTAYSTAGIEPQSASAIYTDGDIPTDFGFRGPPGESGEPGTLSVSVPVDAVIVGVDVSYEMTAHNGGSKVHQRSWLRCVSPGGIGEPQVSTGGHNASGTRSYSRTGLHIANGVRGGGDVIFELHAGRTLGTNMIDNVSTYYNKVDDGTWTVTVHYLEMCLRPQIQAAPRAFEVIEGETGQFRVSLPEAPEHTVTVQVARVSGSTNIVIESGASLEFTPENGTNALPVTIHARPDANWTNDVAVFVCVDPSAAYANSAFITVTEIDIDVDPSTLLPFHENFDDPGKASVPGPLAGQHGWYGCDGATVEVSAGRDGGNALRLTEGYAGHDFANGTNLVVISTWMKAHGGETPGDIPDYVSAVLWVDTNNYINVYNHDEIVVLPVQISPDEYSHIEIRVDYDIGTWQLDVNDTTAFDDFGTYSSQPKFTGVQFHNTTTTPAYFDDIHITSGPTEPVTAFEQWLVQHGYAPSTCETELCANGSSTLREAYIAGFDPTAPDSRFEISQAGRTADNIVLQWVGVEGRRYNVYWSSNLLHGTGFELVASNIPHTASAFTNIIQNGKGFYRIDVQLDE